MRLPGAFLRLPRPSSTSEPSHPPGSLACRAPLRALAKFVPMGEILCMAVNAVRVYRGAAVPFVWKHESPRLHLINGATVKALEELFVYTHSQNPWRLIFKGGDPAAGSPTATLLRLLPPCRPRIRSGSENHSSSKIDSGGATGGVCKEQGRIHRAMVTRGY